MRPKLNVGVEINESIYAGQMNTLKIYRILQFHSGPLDTFDKVLSHLWFQAGFFQIAMLSLKVFIFVNLSAKLPKMTYFWP